jgi:hypothetical protein
MSSSDSDIDCYVIIKKLQNSVFNIQLNNSFHIRDLIEDMGPVFCKVPYTKCGILSEMFQTKYITVSFMHNNMKRVSSFGCHIL